MPKRSSFLQRLAGAGAAWAIAFVVTSARADEPTSAPHPHAYGILVGTNVGGPGQQTLRYAEDDARRMAQVLRELGRYGTTDLRVLARPDSARVLATVDEIAVKLRAHEAKGEQAVLVFYYSGHAKANAFNLGSEELSIATLREKLAKLPTTLTLVVLDACQSGQYARVKGAEPAADFSFNSVSRLTTKGVAVMASSSAQELSQESDELKSSYFTHHLVVALRGAADADGDGRVSLDEAYRYAYRRTLTATAQTQVGSQHVTLETDLAGQGDVPVTYPADARSQLELPAALDARVLVQHKASGNIVAEVQKAPGAPLRLAFVSGTYEALVRRGSPVSVVKCRFALADERVTPLDLSGCEEVKLTAIAKGTSGDRDMIDREEGSVAPWSVEAGAGIIVRNESAFTRRLNEFGYQRHTLFFGSGRRPRVRAHVGFSKGLLPHISLGAQLHTLAGDEYERQLGITSIDTFSWDTYGLSAFVRASTTAGRPKKRGTTFEAYGQLGGGLSLGVTTLTTNTGPGGSTETTKETYWGYVLGGFAGVALVAPRVASFFLQAGYEYAPTIANALGDTHDSGGTSVALGLRLRFD